jgi:small subunit ribosomal protein S8
MDMIADMITRIRNASSVNKENVEVLHSSQNMNILKILKDEGYILDYNEREIRKGIKVIDIELRYHQGQPSIKNIKRISKSSRRVYSSIEDLPIVLNGLGILILSTSHGVISDVEAKQKNVGGELICSVF